MAPPISSGRPRGWRESQRSRMRVDRSVERGRRPRAAGPRTGNGTIVSSGRRHAARRSLAAASPSRAASASSNRNEGWRRGRSRASRSAVAASSADGQPGGQVRRARGTAGVRGQERFEIAVRDQRVDVPESRLPVARRDPGHRAPIGQVARDAAQGPMDQDADRTLGAAEDARDLRGGHLVDEAQDDRPGAGRRGGARRPAMAVAVASCRATVASTSMRTGDDRRPPRAVPRDGPRRRRRRSATTLRAIWKSQTRKVEAPSPSAGRARSSNRPRFVERGQERALRGVLRLVVIAELVVGEAVHLGEVLPVEGLEPGRVRLGRLDEATIAVEVGQPRAHPPPACPTLPNAATGHGVTPGPGWIRRAARGRPRRRGRVAASPVAAGSSTSERRRGPHRRRAHARARRPPSPSRRIERPVVTWRAVPVAAVEAPGAEAR